MVGLVTLLEANRPTVEGDDGTTYLCYLKGRIKRDVGRIMVGDLVTFEPTDPGEARIEAVKPRKNFLLRPQVANVSGLFVVFTLVEPEGSLELLDKRLVAAHLNGMQAEVILAKVDLVKPERFAVVDQAYRAAGYPVWPVSVPEKRGIAELIAQSRQGIWVLTGESGAGKSTLLNAMTPHESVKIQNLSRIGRGQQTTRWVRLFRFQDYWLADSPGHAALEATAQNPRDIAAAFFEFGAFECRFADCLHGREPGCGVVDALNRGAIADWRYRHYRGLLKDWVKTYDTRRR